MYLLQYFDFESDEYIMFFKKYIYNKDVLKIERLQQKHPIGLKVNNTGSDVIQR